MTDHTPGNLGTERHKTEASPLNTRASGLKIYEELGSGSFGKVYRAYDSSLSKVVAIKMIELDTSNDIEDLLLELKFLDELRCEQITRHFYATLHDSVLLVIMEYCAAGSCMHMLRHHSVFREESAAYVLQQTLQGLAYIHSQNKIHRDLKSANILVTQDYKVKIADFGVSAQLSGTIPARNSFMGTPYWMAPEVIESSHYNTAVDMWSLGIVAFELVTGSPPYRKLQPNDAMIRIVRDESPKLPNIIRGYTISKPFMELVAACLSKEPRDRPSATRLLDTKYFRARAKPPTDFKTMVNTTIRMKSDRFRSIKPSTVDDLEFLAPPKSKHSRLNKTVAPSPAEDSVGFDLSSERDVQHHSRPPLQSRQAKLYADRASLPASPPGIDIPLRKPATGNVSPTPQIPPKLRPLRPRPNNTPASPGDAKPRAPRKNETSAEIWNVWMRKALEKVKSRAQVPNAIYEIERLQRSIDLVDQNYTGFTRAFIEELWRLILESAY